MDNENNSNLGSRSENRGKKRKANRIYNILLAIVIVAIIAVAIPIFTGNDENQSNQANDTASENNTTDNENSNTGTDSTQEDKAEENAEEDASDQAKDEENAEEDTEENTIVENSDDSNVSETYVNDGWEPVGTAQTGEHVTNYSQDSVDWQEMTEALAYGAGLSANNMTVWYIGNGGATNKAIGTVSAKDSETTYRVYIEWVDGQGWQPIKVEQLKQNDKR